jgi:phosphatidylglycerophosphatase C
VVVLAAFDFDNTLTTRDCVMPFMRLVAGPATLVRTAATNILPLALAAVGRGDRDDVKASFARRVFAGQDGIKVAEVGRRFAADKMATWLRPDTIGRLRWHQRQGHTVALVSASFGEYLRPLGESLNIEHVLCTELARDGEGRLTGELEGANCRGPEKVRRLQAAFPEKPTAIWAYGDSNGDDAMLAWSTNPTRVGKSLLS